MTMKAQARTLVICNGEPPSGTLLRRLAAQADVVIAADGGANVARAARIRPDIIIGDLDSITGGTRRYFATSLVIRVKSQDSTDLEKALDFLSAQGRRAVVVTGATGRRVDFTLANLLVPWKYASSLSLTFAGDGWRAIPVFGSCRVRAEVGSTVSLIPLGACSGITLRGLQWSLSSGSLGSGEAAVSNVVRSSPFTVKVRRGRAMLVVLDDAAETVGRGPWSR